MRRTTLLVAVFCIGSISQSARAGGWAEFWQRVHVDFQRNNCWPQPFQSQDRELARSPLIAMTAAGWRQNNTLSDHFFASEDQSINQAGELKVRWIATQAPPHRRTVYVLRGPSPVATNARVLAVQRTIEKFVHDQPRPEVALTDAIPPGASGDYFDQVDRQFKQSIPAPRLPAMSDGAGGN